MSKIIERRYGRRQGVVRYWHQQLKLWSGAFRELETIDWPRVDRVVFVCKGNICRSAYAEARASAAGLRSSSFGLATGGGDPADPSAVRASSRQGVDLSAHRSRDAASFAVQGGDLLIGMEPWHAKSLLTRSDATQVTLAGLLVQPRRAHIEDPYDLSDAWFDTCFALLNGAVRRLDLELR